ncbi:MFS transporter [Kribbella sp. NPDC050820]|uniref:MFS transporter n=1 Tax=Kribbella sp. NPDC050820 TaxID=3155408 RepID=UPI0033E84131
MSSSVLAKFADYGLLLVVPLAVLQNTDSVAWSIVAISLRGVAYAVSPLIGALIDRYDRRTLYVAAMILQFGCAAVVALWTNNTAVLSLAVFLSGLGGVASSISGQFVLVPALVVKENRPEAVSKLAFAVDLAKLAGFLLGGVSLGGAGQKFALGVVAACYLLAAAVGYLLPRLPVEAEPQTLIADLLVGFSWLKQRDLAFLVGTMALSNLAIGSLASVLVTLFGDRDVDPTVISVVLAGSLLVGALGSRLGSRLPRRWSAPIRILVCQLLLGAAFFVLTGAPSVWLQALCFGVVEFAAGLSNVASITFRQDVIPSGVAGRVNSVIRMFIAGAIPISGMVYAASEALHVPFWAPAIVLEALSLCVWSVSSWSSDVERRPDRCLDRWEDSVEPTGNPPVDRAEEFHRGWKSAS